MVPDRKSHDAGCVKIAEVAVGDPDSSDHQNEHRGGACEGTGGKQPLIACERGRRRRRQSSPFHGRPAGPREPAEDDQVDDPRERHRGCQAGEAFRVGAVHWKRRHPQDRFARKAEIEEGPFRLTGDGVRPEIGHQFGGREHEAHRLLAVPVQDVPPSAASCTCSSKRGDGNGVLSFSQKTAPAVSPGRRLRQSAAAST